MGSNLEPIPITSQKHDPAWKHCQMFKNGDRVQLKCVYCSKMFKGGGIHRIKEHLAGQKGNASTCLRVPPDVKINMQQSLDGVVVKKRKKQKIAAEITKLNPVSTDMEAFGNDEQIVNTETELVAVSSEIEANSIMLASQEHETSKSGPRRKRGRRKGSGVIATANSVVPVNDSLFSKGMYDNIHMAIGRFLFDIGAPLDAVNSAFFLPMVEAIASGGSGVMMPSYTELQGWILKSSFEEVKNDVDRYKGSWSRTGCSVLVDQQNTVMGRIVLNFLVYSPEGVVFLKSVDASDIINLPDALYDLIRKVVEEIGVRHVLQVITSMEEHYIVAGRRLSNTFPTLYWAPCASHCLDLIFEDFSKLEWINSIIEQARSITRFVYNHSVVLNMLRRYTSGHDIIEPGTTRFATNFSTLKQIVNLKHALQSMVTSQEWMDCPYSRKPGGLEMLDLISNQSFWTSCTLIVNLTNPLLRVLRIVSCKRRPAMGYVYAGMYRAKEAIKKELVKREEYMDYWNIIDHWWEQQWNLPLHASGFYLNPKFFYSIEGDIHNEILSGMFDCIEKLVSDITVQDKIIKEISLYKNAAGDLGRKMAVRSRDTLLPAEWWSTYGGSCPNLLRLAIRILSQTCSLIGYKQNQIPFERLHDAKNCLERQRLCDLVFVQYNLRLRQINEQDIIDPLSFDSNGFLKDWVTEKDLCSDDNVNADFMTLNPPSVRKELVRSPHDEIEDLGAGFNDYEIFKRVKDQEEDNIEGNW
ncbi:hypothetical protein K2173_011897 [Erythroxylum novogranatense]|uniref:BED-type domain-containing protein n=1 Tax=Erythroxylum novogranatense TaxID=1862640 RepID=A0AAV8T217_9ROSI|nr:hypothetical protein K2173_011897 [Erythroxylum novogranatense]